MILRTIYQQIRGKSVLRGTLVYYHGFVSLSTKIARFCDVPVVFGDINKIGVLFMYEIFEALLKKNKQTAYQVSKATGISTATLSDWKSGRSTPKADKLQKIAQHFDVSMDYLTGNEEKPVADNDYELLKDEFVAFYGDVKKELTQSDIEDLKALVRLRAELNRDKK